MNDDINEEEYMNDLENNTNHFSENLPKVVQEFQKSAVQVSHYNEIPAAISFFNILGQIVKDFVTITNGRNHEDTRIHFCWVQTSGTGKSTLWNFINPVSQKTFDMINATNEHPSFRNLDGIPMKRVFDTFSLTDYTDSVLIGKFVKEEPEERGDDPTYDRVKGILEGNGLAHWDEFEYSGVFKQSQHQEKAIVYLNTLMNSLSGDSWVIKKALSSYDNQVMNCYCERSVLAMTYPPSNLNTVMAEKGVLQRMLLYVWEVPEFIQHKMRLEQIDKAGTVEEINQPVDKFANALFELYKITKDRFLEVNGDPLKTMEYTKDFNQVLKLEYENMRRFLQNTRSDVSAIASNFTTRLMKILYKMSVLCSIASAPSIENKDERFKVTGHNVRQAANIIRRCYMTLVDWLERSLKVKRQSIAENSLESVFIDAYNKLEKDEDGFLNKTLLLTEVKDKAKKSRAQVYRHYDVIRHKFVEQKESNNKTYVKLIKGDDE